MMNEEIISLMNTIERVRRGTYSHDVIRICDELASRLMVRVALPAEIKPKFDKKAYQRELMRKRRAKAKL